MFYYYTEEYAITFYYIEDGAMVARNTWFDYKIIPTSRPFVAPPSPKTIYLDVPGKNGKLDYTEALLGRPAFSNRSGSWDFIFTNDGISTNEVLLKIRKELDGRLMNVILEGDPNYYYRGRVQLSGIDSGSDGNGATFTLDYNLLPYKYDSGRMSSPSSPYIENAGMANTKAIDEADISGNGRFDVLNPGPKVLSELYSTGSMYFTLSNREVTNERHDLYMGDRTQFYLGTGRNVINVYGNGRVYFHSDIGRL